MASREAERKTLQRAGYKHRPILCHDRTLKATLLAAGLITDAQLDDDAAINEAAGRYLMRHCAAARVLKDNSAEPPEPKPTKRPKAKRQEKPKHGPVTVWSKEDTERWESGEARPWALFRRWRPSYSGYIRGDPVIMPGNPPRWTEDDDAFPTHIPEIPPYPCERGPRGRSGDRDGRNRSRITGPGPSKSRASRKTIKPLTDKQLKRAEKPYADKLKVEDSSPHFAALSESEMMKEHGLDSDPDA